jgi:hypothetical protein
MNFAFFGTGAANWNGGGSGLSGMLRVLAGRDHKISLFHPAPNDGAGMDGGECREWAQVEEYVETMDGALTAAGHARSADFIVKANGRGKWDAPLTAALLDLKRAWNLVALWDGDPSNTLNRLAENPLDHLHRLIPRFDLVLVAGSTPPSAYLRRGARRCLPVPDDLDLEARATLLESALPGNRSKSVARSGARR